TFGELQHKECHQAQKPVNQAFVAVNLQSLCNWKVNIFLYAVTGAILSFYLSKPNTGLLKFALIFPSVVNLAYAVFFFKAADSIEPWHIDLIQINKALKLISYPNVLFLKKALQISAWLFLGISIGLSFITVGRLFS
ncbi:MAG: hypothetical protein M0Z67_08310, partial [Nitrospiraceae bacterium]|nr:hypothetical protein [Nitrospiraceae bacterium]